MKHRQNQKKHNRQNRQLIAILLLCMLCLHLTACGIVRVEIPESTSENQTGDYNANDGNGNGTTGGNNGTSGNGTTDSNSATGSNGNGIAGGNSATDGNGTGTIPRPQDDFYGYVNKSVLDAMEINYTDEILGTFNDVENIVNEELMQLIAGIITSDEQYAPGSNEQLVREFYQQLLAYCKTNATGSSAKQHFTEVTAKIQAAQTLTDIKNLIKMLTEEEGIMTYFHPNVYQNYYNGKSYALNLNQLEEFAGFELKEIYTQDDTRRVLCSYATNILVTCGDDPKTARKKADDLVYFVIDISCDTDFTIAEAVNPFLALTFYSDEKLDRMLSGSADLTGMKHTPNDAASKEDTDSNEINRRATAGITSRELSEIYNLDNPYGGWMVEDEKQLMCLSDHFCEENVELLKTWLLCEVTHHWQDYLVADYDFLANYAANLRENPEILALTATGLLLSDQLGELYADAYYTEEMDALLHRMYDDITASYRTLITNADWLSKETRDRLLRKLNNIVLVCGGGKRHDPTETEQRLIGRDAFETARNIDLYHLEQTRKKIGTPIDRERSSMDSFVVNAAYNPSNTFTVPVGIMHAPFFDVHADYAENLGGLGYIMAHEIGHAFDSVMIDYDENGAYNPSGIPDVDRAKLKERLKQMEEYYSSFAILGIYHIDGQKTAGENYADKGAMECLMNISMTPEERKKLLVNNARTWLMIMDDDTAISYLGFDVHSPNLIRCNAVLSSTKEFYELYDVQPSDQMYVAPEKRISRY